MYLLFDSRFPKFSRLTSHPAINGRKLAHFSEQDGRCWLYDGERYPPGSFAL